MGGISPIQNAASSAFDLNLATVDVGFTARVGGQTYDADVTYDSGQYIASDSHYYGATATGNTMQSAEERLISRIDVLV